MKKLLPLFFFFTGLISISAQPVNLNWVAPALSYNQLFTAGIAVDAAGNVYTTGSFAGMVDFDPGPATNYLTAVMNYDMFITSVDSSGHFRWVKQIGGNYNQHGLELTLDANANVIVSGNFEDSIDFDPGAGTFYLGTLGPVLCDHGFVMALDSAGNFSWAKELRVGGYDGAAYVYDAVCDADGNTFIAGLYMDTIVIDPNGINDSIISYSGNYNSFIMKLDSAGNILWHKEIYGGVSEANAIALGKDDDIYITGRFNDTVDFDPGSSVFNISSYTFVYDAFIARFDSSGNFTWAKRVGGVADDNAYDIQVDPKGNVLVTGDFRVSGDFDPGPATYNFTAVGAFDIYFLKLDSLGNFVWAKRVSGNPNAYIHSYTLATDTACSVYAGGWFDYQSGGYDFDPGSGTFILTVPAYAGFILKLDSSGDFNFACQIAGGPTSSAEVSCMTLDANQTIYVGGAFKGTVDFDPSPLVNNIYSLGNSSAFTCKFHQDYLMAISNARPENELNIFPNPNNGTFTLQLNNSETADVMIYDAQGKLVSARKIQSGEQITIAEAGMYLVTVTTADGVTSSQRVVVE